jgi:amino-acid N-acetyltransferase
MVDGLIIRPAVTSDIRVIRELIDLYAPQRRLLKKETVSLFESVQEFTVAEVSGEVIGCGALHVMWEDLAEVRTLAVLDQYRGKGVGYRMLDAIMERARQIGVKRLFCLTFETEFFARNGFVTIEGAPVDSQVYAELLHSYDLGVAEFLDLESVKPNTLGNTRMLKLL